jgi:hypothetical protein
MVAAVANLTLLAAGWSANQAIPLLSTFLGALLVARGSFLAPPPALSVAQPASVSLRSPPASSSILALKIAASRPDL